MTENSARSLIVSNPMFESGNTELPSVSMITTRAMSVAGESETNPRKTDPPGAPPPPGPGGAGPTREIVKVASRTWKVVVGLPSAD